MPNLKVLYITFPNRNEAKNLASQLIEKSLIACANIYKIDSLYKWEGKVMDEEEYVLWAKTSGKNIDEIEKFVSEKHSYDLPCITHFDADAKSEYKEWVFRECGPNNS